MERYIIRVGDRYINTTILGLTSDIMKATQFEDISEAKYLVDCLITDEEVSILIHITYLRKYMITIMDNVICKCLIYLN